jgi:hypothetical protein
MQAIACSSFITQVSADLHAPSQLEPIRVRLMSMKPYRNALTALILSCFLHM